MDALCFKAGIQGMIATPIAAAVNGELRLSEKPSVSSAQPRHAPWGFTFQNPVRSLWPVGRNRHKPSFTVDDAVLVAENKDIGRREDENRRDNWVLKIMHVSSIWTEDEKKGDSVEQMAVNSEEDGGICGGENVDCDVCAVDDDDDKIEFDRESFSKLLRKVPLEEARLYGRMSYLGNLAYSISQIKPGNLLKYHGLRFVTSSLEKKEQALKVEKEKLASEEGQDEVKKEVESREEKSNETAQDEEVLEKTNGNHINGSAAYQIAASAASYLHSHTQSILRFKSSRSMENDNFPPGVNRINDNIALLNQDMASLMAKDSVTAVVAAKEEVKQAVADDLKSTRSCPCEWFACDDDAFATRFFVIQGSESMASWQANLLFEPVQFEGLDVLVHRGIYEAAKGLYEQMLPEIHAHIKSCGKRAAFRFTGHSLGGSLSLVINLMLLIRNEVPRSSLLPVITFGAPSVMCGGDGLLRKLQLPRNHVQSITLHRDIVPRAFSCHYPNHVAEFLKAVNGNFRHLPCLKNQKLLYAPTGQLLILQPDNKFSPSHELLPSGAGLYVLTCKESDIAEAERIIHAAQSVFLNSPHPLEILSDRSAYGSKGAIRRDHDMSSYLKCIRNVIRHELSRLRKANREHRKKAWWPLVGPRGVNAGFLVAKTVSVANLISHDQLNLSGIVRKGGESLKRFSRLVASHHMHLLVVFFFPAKLLILEMFNLIKSH